MANAYVIPFDFNPVDTHEFGALGYSYTVPAGKYAIVTYTLTVTASWHGRASASGQSAHTSNGNQAYSGELRLKAGDVLTRSISAPTGTSTADSNVTIVTARLLVNANDVANATTRATFGQYIGAGQTFTISNEATTHAHISEYNIAT